MPDGFGEFMAIRITVKNLILVVLFLLTWVIAFRVFGLSRRSPGATLWRELLQIAKASTAASVFAVLFPLTSQTGAFSGRVLLYFLPVAIVACLCGRLVARAFADRLTSALTGRRDLIIVGSGPRAASLYEHLREPHHGYIRVLGFVDSPSAHTVPAAIRKQMLGTLDDLEGIVMKQPVDEVLIALPAKSCYDEIQTAIQTCERAGVEAKYLSDIFELSLAQAEIRTRRRDTGRQPQGSARRLSVGGETLHRYSRSDRRAGALLAAHSRNCSGNQANGSWTCVFRTATLWVA